MRSRGTGSAHRGAGFTLVELVVVMGLLSGFLLLLTQLMTSGITIFDEGETGQNLADRAQAAARKIEYSFEGLTGPAFDDPTFRDPDGRFLVQPVPLGFVAGGPAPATQDAAPPTTVALLRGEVVLTRAVERSLREPFLREALGADLPADPGDADAVIARMLDREPALGRGRMWFFPWPQGDSEGAYLQLRRGLWVLGAPIDLRAGHQDDATDLVDPRSLTDPTEMSPAAVTALTEVVAEDLLHFEMQFWSQYTTGWETPVTGELPADAGGPERTWDSARGGLLTDLDSGWDFSLDLGPWSLRDPVDDVFPRFIRVILVVGHNPQIPPEARLATPLGADDQNARLIDAEAIPIEDGGMVKIGGEWVEVGRVRGRELRGLKRGRRGTTKQDHSSGTGVRAGRTVVLDLPMAFGRDSWNG